MLFGNYPTSNEFTLWNSQRTLPPNFKTWYYITFSISFYVYTFIAGEFHKIFAIIVGSTKNTAKMDSCMILFIIYRI